MLIIERITKKLSQSYQQSYIGKNYTKSLSCLLEIIKNQRNTQKKLPFEQLFIIFYLSISYFFFFSGYWVTSK